MPVAQGRGPCSDGSHQGNQVRGTGYLHDGATDTLFRFFTADVFQNPGLLFGEANVGFNGGNPQRRDVEQALLAFDSGLAPIVGQQVTLDGTNFADVNGRLSLLEQRAGTTFASFVVGGVTTECDLVAHHKLASFARSYLYDPPTNTYIPDSAAEPPIPAAGMRSIAQIPGYVATFTCVPPGSGARIALDRDGDGVVNYDETKRTRTLLIRGASSARAAMASTTMGTAPSIWRTPGVQTPPASSRTSSAATASTMTETARRTSAATPIGAVLLPIESWLRAIVGPAGRVRGTVRFGSHWCS